MNIFVYFISFVVVFVSSAWVLAPSRQRVNIYTYVAFTFYTVWLTLKSNTKYSVTKYSVNWCYRLIATRLTWYSGSNVAAWYFIFSLRSSYVYVAIRFAFIHVSVAVRKCNVYVNNQFCCEISSLNRTTTSIHETNNLNLKLADSVIPLTSSGTVKK